MIINLEYSIIYEYYLKIESCIKLGLQIMMSFGDTRMKWHHILFYYNESLSMVMMPDGMKPCLNVYMLINNILESLRST